MIGELDAIKRLLWQDWDPIGLNGSGPDDEYDSYAFQILGMLNKSTEASEIAEYLRWAAIENMGLSGAGDCAAVARRIVEIHERER